MGKTKRDRTQPEQLPEPRRAGFLRKAWGRREPVMWAALFALVLTIQWPTVKGWYFRAAGTPAPASAIAWRADLDAALAEARASGKKGVVVDFYASWCPPCIAMKHEVWPDPAVVRAIDAGYLAVQIDADRDRVYAPRYRVETLPTVLLLDAGGTVLKRTTGFLSQAGVIDMLASDRR